MFIARLKEKLRRSPDRENYEKKVLAKYTADAQRCADAAAKWRSIPALTTTVRDKAWEMFFEYTRSAVALALLRRERALGENDETKAVFALFASLLYPHDDYAGVIADRIEYLFERAATVFGTDGGDRYSPLDDLRHFQQMMSVHLWMQTEIGRMLEKYRSDYVATIRRELLKVEFEQSRCEVSDQQYLYCERSYNQILNRVGEFSRPAAPTIYNTRSAWEIRTAFKDKVRSSALLRQDAGTHWSWERTREMAKCCRSLPSEPPPPREPLLPPVV